MMEEAKIHPNENQECRNQKCRTLSADGTKGEGEEVERGAAKRARTHSGEAEEKAGGEEQHTAQQQQHQQQEEGALAGVDLKTIFAAWTRDVEDEVMTHTPATCPHNHPMPSSTLATARLECSDNGSNYYNGSISRRGSLDIGLVNSDGGGGSRSGDSLDDAAVSMLIGSVPGGGEGTGGVECSPLLFDQLSPFIIGHPPPAVGYPVTNRSNTGSPLHQPHPYSFPDIPPIEGGGAGGSGGDLLGQSNSSLMMLPPLSRGVSAGSMALLRSGSEDMLMNATTAAAIGAVAGSLQDRPPRKNSTCSLSGHRSKTILSREDKHSHLGGGWADWPVLTEDLPSFMRGISTTSSSSSTIHGGPSPTFDGSSSSHPPKQQALALPSKSPISNVPTTVWDRIGPEFQAALPELSEVKKQKGEKAGASVISNGDGGKTSSAATGDEDEKHAAADDAAVATLSPRLVWSPSWEEEACEQVEAQEKVEAAWSSEEEQGFEDGIRAYRKSFSMISRKCVTTKTVKDIIAFYYRYWKRSKCYPTWKQDKLEGRQIRQIFRGRDVKGTITGYRRDEDGDELFDIKYDDGFTGCLYRYECEPLLVHPSNHLQGIPSMTSHGDTIHCVGDCCTSTEMMMD